LRYLLFRYRYVNQTKRHINSFIKTNKAKKIQKYFLLTTRREYMFIKFSAVLTLLLISNSLIKSQVSIDGEIRPRSEFRQGYKRPLPDSLKPAFETLQRSRLSFDYKSKILKTLITIQDARIWGQSEIASSDSKLEIFEAWAECAIDSSFSVKFGRQCLKYDDQRLFASGEWNTGNAHDLLLIKYQPSKLFEIHGGLAYNNSVDTLMNQNYSVHKLYKTMGFLWISKSLRNGIKISAIAIEEGLQKRNEYKIVYPRFTGGSNLVYQNDSSRINFSLLGYYQLGKSWSYLDLKAYMAAVKISFKFYKSNAIIGGTDYYSGTKPNANPEITNTFNKLYGANHSVNGTMEYWRKIPYAGLVDYYGGVYFKFSARLSTNLTYHFFRFSQNYILNNVNINKNIGSELDFVIDFNVNKQIALQTGYCTYFTTSSTLNYLNMSDATIYKPQWAYLMLTIRPNLYKTSSVHENS